MAVRKGIGLHLINVNLRIEESMDLIILLFACASSIGFGYLVARAALAGILSLGQRNAIAARNPQDQSAGIRIW